MSLNMAEAPIIVVSESDYLLDLIVPQLQELKIGNVLGVLRHKFFEPETKFGSLPSFVFVFPYTAEQIILFNKTDSNSWYKVLKKADSLAGRTADDDHHPKLAIVFSNTGMSVDQELFHLSIAKRFWKSGNQPDLEAFSEQRRLFSLENHTFSYPQMQRLKKLLSSSKVPSTLQYPRTIKTLIFFSAYYGEADHR